MRQNKNGFTLIEIIVSLAIGSIVLLIAGTMIVSSSGFLSTTTDYDIDKMFLDTVRNRLYVTRPKSDDVYYLDLDEVFN